MGFLILYVFSFENVGNNWYQKSPTLLAIVLHTGPCTQEFRQKRPPFQFNLPTFSLFWYYYFTSHNRYLPRWCSKGTCLAIKRTLVQSPVQFLAEFIVDFRAFSDKFRYKINQHFNMNLYSRELDVLCLLDFINFSHPFKLFITTRPLQQRNPNFYYNFNVPIMIQYSNLM
jgi:hypothetical protein